MMKRIILFSGMLAVTFALASTVFAQGFEGTMTMQMSIPQMGGNPISIEVSMKGTKSVMTTNMPFMGETKVYADAATQKTIIVNGGKKGYEVDNSKEPETNAADTIAPVATGQRKTINGYACELYTAKAKDADMDIWETADFPKDMVASIAKSYHSMMGGMRATRGGGPGSALKRLTEKGLVPVEVDVKKDGSVMATLEFVKYEKKPLDDAMFVVPADVKIGPPPTGRMGMRPSGGH